MTGREEKKSNDLFYLCSLIEFIARKTKNHRRDVVNKLGEETLTKIYNLADIYHCEDINDVAAEFISLATIQMGDFDNVSAAKFSVPTHWDIGKVYKRLIFSISKERNIDVISALMQVYNSFVSDKIDDYNSSVYYDNPQNILLAFTEGTMANKK